METEFLLPNAINIISLVASDETNRTKIVDEIVACIHIKEGYRILIFDKITKIVYTFFATFLITDFIMKSHIISKKVRTFLIYHLA